MNDQTKKYMINAWEKVEGPPQEGHEDIRDALVENLYTIHKVFAESIIYECVNICMKNQFDGATEYNNGSVSSAEFIKQHFGVE